MIKLIYKIICQNIVVSMTDEEKRPKRGDPNLTGKIYESIGTASSKEKTNKTSEDAEK